jgi:propanol-preferring alcohol dehydrogenase
MNRAMGMRPIAIDGGDVKQRLCEEMGAEVFIDFTKEKDVAAKVKEVADGIGAHGVLVTAYQAYKDSVSYIGDRIGGKIMAIAVRIE